MKIRITKEGWLEIERAKRFKRQYCPFALEGGLGLSTCGDWCPLFGEISLIGLKLCHRDLFVDSFDDMRNLT